MKSGLYACAGASATASAAAWAKRFDEPITKESKVYFVLKPPLSGRFWTELRALAAAGASIRPSRSSGSSSAVGVGSLTRSSIGRSRPVTSRIAAPIRPRKWPSTQSRVKSFGTARTKRSSASSSPRASPNHVPYVVSLSAPLSRPATSPHRLSAVSSIWCSTLLSGPSASRNAKNGEHTNLRKHCKWRRFAGVYQMREVPPQLWRTVGETPRSSFAPRGWPVDKAVDACCLYWPPDRPPNGGISGNSLSYEAHLSAQRPPPQAQARLPHADVLARRPADPQAAPREGPQAPLGVVPCR